MNISNFSEGARPNELMFLDSKEVDVIRTKTDRLALRFSVDIEIEPSTEKLNPGAWVTISGNLASVDSAKAYIKGLVNPEEMVELWIPYEHFGDLTDSGNKVKLERETHAVIEYKEEMDNAVSFKATIRGEKSAVSSAMEVLKGKVQRNRNQSDHHQPPLFRFSPPRSPTSSSSLDQKLLGLSNQYDINKDNLDAIPDVVKRLMVSWADQDKEHESTNSKSGGFELKPASRKNGGDGDSSEEESDMETDDSLDDAPPTRLGALHQMKHSDSFTPQTGIQRLLTARSKSSSTKGLDDNPLTQLGALHQVKHSDSFAPQTGIQRLLTAHSKSSPTKGLVESSNASLNSKPSNYSSAFLPLEANKPRTVPQTALPNFPSLYGEEKGLTVDLTKNQPKPRSTIYTLSSDEEDSEAKPGLWSNVPPQTSLRITPHKRISVAERLRINSPRLSLPEVNVKGEQKAPVHQTIAQIPNKSYVMITSEDESSDSDDSDLHVLSSRADQTESSSSTQPLNWTRDEKEIHEHVMYGYSLKAQKMEYDSVTVATVNSQFDHVKDVTEEMYLKALKTEVAAVKTIPPSFFQSSSSQIKVAAHADVRPKPQQPNYTRTQPGAPVFGDMRTHLPSKVVQPFRQEVTQPTPIPQPNYQYPPSMVPSNVMIGLSNLAASGPVRLMPPGDMFQSPRLDGLYPTTPMDTVRKDTSYLKAGIVDSHRQVVLDGSNIAMRHGKKNFSVRGIAIAIKTLEEKYHVPSAKITCVVPQRKYSFLRNTGEGTLLEQLIERDYITISPGKKVGNHVIAPYDDRLILDLAVQHDGVVISNDRYLDFLHDRKYTDIVEHRVIMFTFHKDIFHVDEQEPMGRNGPTLRQLLSQTAIHGLNSYDRSIQRKVPQGAAPHHFNQQPFHKLMPPNRTPAHTANIRRQMEEMFPHQGEDISSVLSDYPDILDTSELTEIMLSK